MRTDLNYHQTSQTSPTHGAEQNPAESCWSSSAAHSLSGTRPVLVLWLDWDRTSPLGRSCTSDTHSKKSKDCNDVYVPTEPLVPMVAAADHWTPTEPLITTWLSSVLLFLSCFYIDNDFYFYFLNLFFHHYLICFIRSAFLHNEVLIFNSQTESHSAAAVAHYRSRWRGWHHTHCTTPCSWALLPRLHPRVRPPLTGSNKFILTGCFWKSQRETGNYSTKWSSRTRCV